MAKKRRCIGFGEFEGKCANEAGTKWTPYWCERCDQLRMAHISKSLEEIDASFSAAESTGIVGPRRGNEQVSDRR